MSENNEHEHEQEPEGTVTSAGEGARPPLEDIEIPKTITKSATIRWLHGLGYGVSEISKHLGCRYQMVRNIITTVPKRAAREDLPPLVVKYKETPDIMSLAIDAELDRSLMADRKERNRQRKEALKANPDTPAEDID